jgi:transcriptional regulator with XRE-family HTH domain
MTDPKSGNDSPSEAITSGAWDRERGSQLKAARIHAEKSQDDLAAVLDVSQATVSNWERAAAGQRPSDDQIAAIQSFLGRVITDTVVETDQESLTDLSLWLKQNLRKKQDELRETVDAIAARIGLSTPTLYNIINGTVTSPHPRTLESLGRFFGPLPSEVTRETDEAREVGTLGEFTEFPPYNESEWPAETGVYVLYDVTDRPVYVGKSKVSVANRIRDHSTRFWFRSPIVERAAFVAIEDADLILAVEDLLIKFLRAHAVLNKKGVVRDPLD